MTERQAEPADPIAATPAVMPQTTTETVNALVHFYRGELGRMAGWRDRIDRTSNWAITATAAMLSLSLSTPDSHHGLLIFAMLIVTLLLWIEARRYRFFDVYRSRIRVLERHYIAPVLSPGEAAQDQAWREELASSLRDPTFLMGMLEATSRRLRRNYVWMYLIIALAWGLKVSTPRLQSSDTERDMVRTLAEIASNADLGPLPGVAVILLMAAFLLVIAFLALRSEPDDGAHQHGDAHV